MYGSVQRNLHSLQHEESPLWMLLLPSTVFYQSFLSKFVGISKTYSSVLKYLVIQKALPMIYSQFCLGLGCFSLVYGLIYIPLKYIIPASETLQDYWLIKKRVSSFLPIMGTYLDAEMQIIALARKIEEKNSR